jgi:hypothetical protein
MPINPLELQTNLSQIAQVGKIQSSIKDADSLKDTQINLLIQKNSEKESDDVPMTKDIEEGIGKIKEEKKKKQQKKDKDKKTIESEIEKEDDKKNENQIKNPEIGQHIDIVG